MTTRKELRDKIKNLGREKLEEIATETYRLMIIDDIPNLLREIDNYFKKTKEKSPLLENYWSSLKRDINEIGLWKEEYDKYFSQASKGELDTWSVVNIGLHID